MINEVTCNQTARSTDKQTKRLPAQHNWQQGAHKYASLAKLGYELLLPLTSVYDSSSAYFTVMAPVSEEFPCLFYTTFGTSNVQASGAVWHP